MEQKGYRDIIILACVLVAGISLLLISNLKSKQIIRPPNTTNPTPSLLDSSCSKEGEAPVSNFDMTTGKTNPNIKTKDCCLELRAIDKKQSIINSNPDICSRAQGVNNSICSPCGNGVCDSQYEDHCNCPEDCEE